MISDNFTMNVGKHAVGVRKSNMCLDETIMSLINVFVYV